MNKNSLIKLRVLVLCAVVALCSFVGLAINVGDTFEEGGINYKVLTLSGNIGTCEITSSPSAAGDVVIPGIVIVGDVWAKYDCFFVTAIEKEAFYSRSSLKSIDLSDATELTSIGRAAFCGCVALTSVKLPASVATIEKEAFYKCTSLKSIDLSGATKLTSIETATFCGCDSLTSVKLPASVTTIDRLAFGLCSFLKSVDLSGATSLEVIGEDAFNSCFRLTSIDLSGATNLTSMGETAFEDCASLTSMDLSGATKLTSMGRAAFSSCNYLASVRLPSSLTSMGGETFSECYALAEIQCDATMPPIVDESDFEDVDLSKCKLIIPAGSEESYRVADVWNGFESVDPTGIDGVIVDDNVVEIARYDVNGLKLSGAQKGLNIVYLSNGGFKKVFVAE